MAQALNTAGITLREKLVGIRKMEQKQAIEKEYLSRYDRSIMSGVAHRSEEAIIRVDPVSAADAIVVAVAVSSTTRGTGIVAVEELPLVVHLLPSLVRTAERGFEYWVYGVHDDDDIFWENKANTATLRTWFTANVQDPLSKKGITVKMAILRFNNPVHKPGPAFNFMLAAAVADGAEYLYRVNDDTEFIDQFSTVSVETLQAFSPPNFGVVGPICKQGNEKILTHDFVHRQHLEIFGMYYPPELSDWWMDDWITHVYGEEHTVKGPHSVFHHVGTSSTRYEVNFEHAKLLQGAVRLGRQKISDWLNAKKEAYMVLMELDRVGTDIWGKYTVELQGSQAKLN